MQYGVVTLFILIFTGFVTRTSAQQNIFTNYTVNDGLVANYVRTIHQDKKGFIWIGTLEGVSKYDGHLFTNYTTANGLSDNMINDFYETGDGTLYIAPNDGSLVIAGENRLLPCIKPSTTVINRFLKKPDGKIIVTTGDNGLAEFNGKNLTRISQPFPLIYYTEIINLDDSLFLAVNDTSLQVFTRNYELFSCTREKVGFFTDYRLLKDSKNRIWAGAYGGLKQIRRPVKKGEPLSFLPLPAAFDLPVLKQNTITAIFEDNEQTIWIGTTKGLVKINPDGSHRIFTTQDGLVSDRITSIFQDREMNMWFGTLDGVSKLVTSSGIRIYTEKDGLAPDPVSFVCPYKKDNLLVQTPGRLQVFNTRTETFTAFPNSSGIYSFGYVQNSHPSVLFSTDGLNSVDTVSGLLTKTYSFDRSYWFATNDSQKNFFLYGNDGLFFTTGGKKPIKILEHRTQAVIIDNNGFLWACTWSNGLYRMRYSVRSDSIYIQTKEHYFPGERFRSLFPDSKGNIWAGTRTHGVYIINAVKPAEYLLINQHRGLLSDFVKQVAEDKEGNIWLSYFHGFDRLTKTENGYRIFNFSRINNFFPVVNSMSYYENSIWLSTTKGLVRINDSRADNIPPLPVYITKISSADSVYSSSAAAPRLSYRKNKLQFEFSSPGFINEKQVLYSYRLTGSENNNWSAASNEHTVSFASLRPGSYVFEVRSQGWNGQWGEAASFSFEILPPFWQTWWFRSLCVLLVTGLTVWFVKRRIRYIRHESELKHKMAETEMAALRSQMNPHFIFNCLNAIDNLIQTNQKEKATTYLSRFAKLIRNVLDSSKNNTVLFQKDLESLNLYLQIEQFRSNNKFEYELQADPELLNSDFKIPPLVIQPFVENAIHHGLLNKQTGERKLIVSAKLENNYINYSITDNGVGRAKAGEIKELNKPGNQSYGIDITRERLHLHNQEQRANDIKITDLFNDNEPAGTKVELRIKIYDTN